MNTTTTTGPEERAACPHGILWPHECSECVDAVPQEVADRWLLRESIANGIEQMAREAPALPYDQTERATLEEAASRVRAGEWG